MKNILLFFSFFLFSLVSSSQDNTKVFNDKVVIGKVDSIQSSVLNETRKVWIYMPNGLDEKSTNRYPVVYLLDGPAHFYSVVGLIQQFSQVNGNTVCPEMIVVAIANTDRTRDLTPTYVKGDPPYVDSNFTKTSGGGEKFISFLKKELIPHIDANYPTQPFKMLIGHSFGGLMAMHILANHTDMFNAYISIDPSMWWDNMNYLKQAKEVLQKKQFTHKTLYLGYANTMEEGMDINTVQQDKSPMTRHIRAILSVDTLLRSRKDNGLSYASKFYQEDGHTTVPVITEHDALRYIFRNFRFKLESKDYVDSTADLAGKFEQHYIEASKFFGYSVFPAEKLIEGWGAEFAQIKHYVKAEKFYLLNIRHYPQSPGAHATLADFYVQRGEKQKAIESFKKSLQLKQDPDTQRKLDELIK
jgi:predicted alpha/beta superfamily hydrolase